MNDIKLTDDYKPLIKILQYFLFLGSFVLSGYYDNLANFYLIGPSMIGIAVIDKTFIILYLVFTALLSAGLFFLAIKFIYFINTKIFYALYNKIHKDNYILPDFPISYNNYIYNLVWFLIITNTFIGSLRIIYFTLPYAMPLIESVVPIIISVISMFFFFYHMKKKYIADQYIGSTFISLAIPYILYIIILM